MSFRLKITVCMVWLLALIFGIGGGLMISLSFRRSLEHEMSSARSTFQMTTETLRLVNAVGESESLGKITDTLAALRRQNAWSSVRLAVDGVAVYGDGTAASEMLALASDTAHYRAAAFTGNDGRRYLQIGGLLTADREVLALDIAYDITPVYETRAQQLELCRKLFLILISAGALLAWSAAWLLTRPLRALSRASRELARGKLDFRARVRTRDEVGALAADFNNMAEKLEAGVAELEQSVERQERFMGSFAHEMKTPMTSIIGYADLLRAQALAPEEQMDAANYIFSEGKRLETLSLKLLDLLVTKKQTAALTAVEPAQMIAALTAHLRPILAEQNIRLQCRCEPGWRLMEPDLIRSLLMNLIDNARKAMDGGGNICIVSDMLEDGCRIRVFDNGRGMPEEALAHLTEAFYRVDKSRSRAQGGVGLGLTLCHEIARLHGGEITFESRVGNGTCVTVTLKGGAA